MIRNRITIQFAPSPVAESIFLLEDVGDRSEMLEAFSDVVRPMAEMLREADVNIGEILVSLAEEGVVEVDGTYVDQELQRSRDLEAAHVAFSLRELAADPRGLDDALRVHALLEWLDATGCWNVRVLFGGCKATTAQIVEELSRSVPGFAAAEALQRDEGEHGPTDAAAAGAEFCSFVGGAELPDWTSLGEAACEILQLAGLLWPCELTELKQAFRRLAFAHHPDRRPGDTDAARRFARINEGYLELAGLLHEGAAQ